MGNLVAELVTVGYGDASLTVDEATQMVNDSTLGLVVGRAVQCDGCQLWHAVVLRSAFVEWAPVPV